MIEILKMSCEEDMDCTDDNGSNPYLERSDSEAERKSMAKTMTKEEQATEIKKLFTMYTSEGMPPNMAAAKAINDVANAKNVNGDKPLLPGTLQGQMNDNDVISYASTIHLNHQRDVLHTAKKYIENVQKKPYSPKFRCFKVSNRFFDNITQAEGGLDYIVKCLGFRTYINSADYMASIPLSVDIDALKERVEHLLNSI